MIQDRTPIINFIKKRPHLIWWTRSYDKLKDEPIVEATLNYGDWQDVQKLLEISEKKIKQELIKYALE